MNPCRARATELAALEPVQQHTLQHEPSREQFDAAKAAALALIDSGALGDPAEHRFGVTLAGHGNPGHVPAVGYVTDSTSISATQLDARYTT